MRTREEIEKDLGAGIKSKQGFFGTISPEMASAITGWALLEVLLDIRELLQEKSTNPQH